MLESKGFRQEYLPHTTNTPEDFFRAAIGSSCFYRRAAGFFSSGVFNLFSYEFLDFAKKGGKIELICSNQLSSDDAAVLCGSSFEDMIEANISQEIERLEEVSTDALDFFATLLKLDILSIKIAHYSTGGMFHDKTGYFEDETGKSISFRGSSNETYMGWSTYGNFESLEAFCSWKQEDQSRVNNHREYLEKIWNNKLPELTVSEFPEFPKHLLIKRARADVDDFKTILQQTNKQNAGKTVVIPRRLNSFQSQTIENWKKNKYRGIVKHATGSGKTITALAAVIEHLELGLPALIVVPSTLLLRQWHTEILRDKPDAKILLCGDGNTEWKQVRKIRNLLSNISGSDGAIILGVLDTVTNKSFLSKLVNKQDILLVADEVHALGSAKALELLSHEFGKRMGLSATPERHRDVEGTEALFRYFGGIIEPQITIFDAIKNGRLVNYLYHPTSVPLTDEETEIWREITKKIIALGNSRDNGATKENQERIKQLFLRRSRVAKKAENKIAVAASIIRKHFELGEHWLVYCEDSEQLGEINDLLVASGHIPHMYKTDMGKSKDAELNDYVRKGGIMLSIRCLDEGIDIPKISHAVIMASSQNPRQFIQRRGRVLRVDGVKDKAVIYDLFTVPNSTNVKANDSLVKSELMRSLEFANGALNHTSALTKLRQFLLNIGLEIDEVAKASKEII